MSGHSPHAMPHLDFLAAHIGPRPVGTSAHHDAERYIRDAFQASGLLLEEVSLGFPDWSLIESGFSQGGMPLAVDVNPFSPSCDVMGSIVAVSTLPELEAADLRGRVALLYGELSKEPIFPINFELVQFERDQTINRLLIEKVPLAVLAVNLNPWRRVHIFEDEDFPFPSATVPAAVGRHLLTHPGDEVHLHIHTHMVPSHVTTIVGRTPPRHTQRVVICAHYDTKVGTPGAFDNGTGAAMLLALAETLPKTELAVDLEFVAWADEEYGAHTDMAYTRRFEDSFGNILCAINLDGVGLVTQNTTLTMLAQSPAFEEAIRTVHARYPAVVWVDPWVQSNHSTFALRGVPCIALTSLTWERAHQAEDTVEWISPARLDEAMALVTEMVQAIQDQPPSWSRP